MNMPYTKKDEEFLTTAMNKPEPVKISDWKKEPQVTDLKRDLEAAKPAHDTVIARIKHWNNLLKVEGECKPPKRVGRSSIQPKLIRRQAEWRYPALSEPFLGSSKLFSVKPVTFEDTEAARQNQLVLNWQFRTKLNKVVLIDHYTRTAVDEGTAVVQVGWSRKLKKVKQTANKFDFFAITTPEEQAQIEEAIGMHDANIRAFKETAPEEIQEAVAYFKETGDLVVARLSGTEEVEVDEVVENQPTVVVHDPQNVVFDPSCNGDLEKCKFAVVSFETSHADLSAQTGRYKNLDAVDWSLLSPTINVNDHATSTPSDYNFRDTARKRVVAYEYWGEYDIHGTGELVPIVATWIGDVMIRLEVNPFPDQKLPFVVVNYLPVKRELYGEADAEVLEDSQRVLGAVTRGIIDSMGRSANAQRGMAKGMLDAANQRRYEAGDDYFFNPNIQPQQGVVEHKYPEIPQSAMNMIGLSNQEAESMTGVKAFSGGLSGNAYGDVAAGVRGMLDAASKREMAILRRLAKGWAQIGTKIMMMNAVFLSEEEVIRVTNTQFVTVKREDLAGNFDLEVDISTAEIDDEKSKDLSFMLQTLGPKGDPKMVMDILAEICELKRMPEFAERLRRWEPPQPTEQQLMMEQLEIEKLQLENDKLRAEAEEARARARKALAEADKANLDFVEQETGTKHARDMEKQQGQAQGNQNLQVTKALTTPRKDGEAAPDLEAAIGFNQMSDKLNNAPVSALQRDQAVPTDPTLNLGSKFYDPARDPATNLNMQI